MIYGYDTRRDDYEKPDTKSRSQVKREMTALQNLGEELVALGPEAIRKAPLTADLKEAVLEAKRLTKHEAKRRKMQFIGKIMRTMDTGPVQDFLDTIKSGRSKADKAFQQIEQWRDQLLDGNDELMDELAERFPATDRQRLRQLTLSARRERAKGQPPKHFRALFRYLRELAAEV